MGQYNFVYIVLQIIDYIDRNFFRFQVKNVVSALMEEDLDIDIYDADNGNWQGGDEPGFMPTVTPEQIQMRIEQENIAKTQKKFRINLIKSKIKSVIMKNIKSFKTCLKKRLDAKNYPQSNNIVVEGFGLLRSLCEHSTENRGAIFTDDGWYHFDRIYRKHPLKSIHLLQDLLEKDKSILHIDLTVWSRIFGLYKSFLNRIIANNIKGIPTNDGVLIFAWNSLLAEILKIDTKQVPLPKVIHMFLSVQQCITPELLDFVFSKIINEAALDANDGVDQERLDKFFFQMINRENSVLQGMFENNDYYVGIQQDILLMEVAYSFLRLINKATKHVYDGHMLKLGREHFGKL